MSEQERLEDLIVRLRENGYRMTPQRVAVIKVLIDCTDHPDAEQIYDHIKHDFPTTSLATVYKTVTMLKEMGEILELNFGNGSTRYDCREPHHHPHLVCTKCGSIKDIDIDIDIFSIEELAREVAQMTGYQVTSHRLDFLGTCPQCQP